MTLQAKKRKTVIKSKKGRRSIDRAPDRYAIKEKPAPPQDASPLHNVPSMNAQEIVELTAKMLVTLEPQKKQRKSPLIDLSRIKISVTALASNAAQNVSKTSQSAIKVTSQAMLAGFHHTKKTVHWYIVLFGHGVIWASQALINATIQTIQGTALSLHRTLRPSALATYHQILLQFTHRLIFDRKLEKNLFIPAGKPADPGSLTISSTHKNRSKDYRSTPSQIFKWATIPLPEDLSRFTFVDYGAGRGRILLLAARRNFKKVIGTEFAHELQEDAIMNIAQFPRSLMKCRDIECFNVTATRLPVPEGQSVFYLFNPFDEEIFSRILKQIVTSYHRTPRRLYLLTVDYDVEHLILEQGIFEPLKYSAKDQIKQMLFSPLKIRGYKTIV